MYLAARQPLGLPCGELLVPISFALATMPRWWPQGYLHLLSLSQESAISGCPKVYSVHEPRFGHVGRRGIRSCDLGRRGFAWDCRCHLSSQCALRSLHGIWTRRSDVHLVSAVGGTIDGFVWAGLAWLMASLRRLGLASPKNFLRGSQWSPLAIELGILFYASGRPNGAGRSYFRGRAAILTELVSRSPRD